MSREGTMTITTILKSSTAISIVALLALSACGGGGGGAPDTGGMPPDNGDGDGMMPGDGDGDGDGDMDELKFGDGISLSPAAAVNANSSSDSLAILLPGGNSTFAPVSAVVLRDFIEGVSALPEEDVAFVRSISADGANGFRVTFVVDGSESLVHFTADSWSDQFASYSVSLESNAKNYLLWSMTDSMYRDPNDRTSGSSTYDYFDSIGWQVSALDDLFEGYSTFGARTRSDNMPMTGSATYYGSMFARLWAGDDPSYPSGRASLLGSLELNADFGSGEISGVVDEFSAQVGDFTNPFEPMREGNSFDISNGVIVDGQFSADWVSVDTNALSSSYYTVSGLEGTMVGEFYGPGAEEVGGAIGGHGAAVSSIPDFNLAGVFGAVREDVAQPAGQ